jgi:hypothetical protein
MGDLQEAYRHHSPAQVWRFAVDNSEDEIRRPLFEKIPINERRAALTGRAKRTDTGYALMHLG